MFNNNNNWLGTNNNDDDQGNEPDPDWQEGDDDHWIQPPSPTSDPSGQPLWKNRNRVQQNQYFWTNELLHVMQPVETDYSDYTEAVGDDYMDEQEWVQYANWSRMDSLADPANNNPTVEMEAEEIMENHAIKGLDEDTMNNNNNKMWSSSVLGQQNANGHLQYTTGEVMRGLQMIADQTYHNINIPSEAVDELNARYNELPPGRNLYQERFNRNTEYLTAVGATTTFWNQQGYQNPQNEGDIKREIDNLAHLEREVGDTYAFHNYMAAKTEQERETWAKVMNRDQYRALKKYEERKEKEEKEE